MCIATRSGMPARTRLRTAVRRKSGGIRPGQPAAIRFPPRLVESALGDVLPGLLTHHITEDVAHDRPVLALQRVGNPLLLFEDTPQLAGQREDASVPVLRSGVANGDATNISAFIQGLGYRPPVDYERRAA